MYPMNINMYLMSGHSFMILKNLQMEIMNMSYEYSQIKNKLMISNLLY